MILLLQLYYRWIFSLTDLLTAYCILTCMPCLPAARGNLDEAHRHYAE